MKRIFLIALTAVILFTGCTSEPKQALAIRAVAFYMTKEQVRCIEGNSITQEYALCFELSDIEMFGLNTEIVYGFDDSSDNGRLTSIKINFDPGLSDSEIFEAVNAEWGTEFSEENSMDSFTVGETSFSCWYSESQKCIDIRSPY